MKIHSHDLDRSHGTYLGLLNLNKLQVYLLDLIEQLTSVDNN